LAGTAEVIDAEIEAKSPVHRMWELHKSEIQRLRKTAETFLSFARPTPIARAPIDINDVAARLNDLAAAQARRQDIELRLDLANKPVVVDGDLDQLAQVVLNIALNALKAMETSGTLIRISTGTEVLHEIPHAFIRVENNGPPIPIEDRENLFNPFHSGLGGTGLGLSISDRIVRQHNGCIEISEGTLGVSFTVFIPSATG
jgi:two-component system NtrC family sensor kinase